MTMLPEVRYLIVCDEVRTDPQNSLRLDVIGLLTNLRSTAVPAFPVVRPEFCVLVVVTNYQRSGEVSVRLLHSQTNKIIFQNRPRLLRFVGPSGEMVGISFRIKNCSFPAEGLYWVELVFSGTILARQVLTVTERVDV